MQIITYDQVNAKIMEIRNQKVILDSDVAELYGVETREINQAIKRNGDKFPVGYIMELSDTEWDEVKSQFVISKFQILPLSFFLFPVYKQVNAVRKRALRASINCRTVTTICALRTFIFYILIII
mgnify:CR=1 FL=1